MEKAKRQTAKDLLSVGDWIVWENGRAAGKVTRVTASWARVEGVVSYCGELIRGAMAMNRMEEMRQARKVTQEEAEATGARWLAEQTEKWARVKAEDEERRKRMRLSDEVLRLVRAVLMEMTSEDLLRWRRFLTEGLMMNLAGRVRPGGDTPQ